MSPGLGTNGSGAPGWPTGLARLAGGCARDGGGVRPMRRCRWLKALYLQALSFRTPVWRRRCWTGFRSGASAALRWMAARRTRPRSTASARTRGRCWRRPSRRSIISWMAGLILRKGTLMDATLVASASRPPPYKAGAGAGHPRERGAGWTRKKGRGFFGYKAHLGVDQGSSLIRRLVLARRRAGCRSADLRRRRGRSTATAPRGQAATGEAQGRRHQGPDPAPAEQAHPPAALAAGQRPGDGRRWKRSSRR